MRELELLPQAQIIAFSLAERRRAPLANPVHGQNGRGLKGAGEEGAGGVALVVVREDESRFARDVEALAQRPSHVKLILQPQRYREAEAPEAGGRVSKISLQQPVKLRQRLVIEGDAVQILRLESSLGEAVGDGVGGKAGVMLLAREPFLLGRRNNIPLHDQRRGAVVVECGDAENGCHLCRSPAPVQTRAAAGSRLVKAWCQPILSARRKP